MKHVTTVFIFFLTLNLAQAQSWWNSKKVTGNGNLITKTRTINEFDNVSVGGHFDVILVEGNENKLTLEGEENILPFIITTVKKGTLKIKVKENTNIKTTRKLVITVPFEHINGISLGGSGNVIAKKTISANKLSFAIGGSGNIIAKINASKASCSIGGSGDIKLKGTTNNLSCSIAGSGKVKAYELKTDTVNASIAGSGDVYITVKTKVKANVVGSGSVYYKGNPKYIDSNSLGSGDIINKN